MSASSEQVAKPARGIAGWPGPGPSASLPAAVGRRAGRTFLGVVLSLAGVIMIAPIAWVVIESFETPNDQFRIPPVWVPSHLTVGSYRTLFSAAPFVDNLLNSLFVTV